MGRRTDTRIEKLQRKMFDRNTRKTMANLPGGDRTYIPDPVKWRRLNQIQKQQYITEANNDIDAVVRVARVTRDPQLSGLYASRPHLYRGLVIPPGFDSVQNYLGAIIYESK